MVQVGESLRSTNEVQKIFDMPPKEPAIENCKPMKQPKSAVSQSPIEVDRQEEPVKLHLSASLAEMRLWFQRHDSILEPSSFAGMTIS